VFHLLLARGDPCSPLEMGLTLGADSRPHGSRFRVVNLRIPGASLRPIAGQSAAQGGTFPAVDESSGQQ